MYWRLHERPGRLSKGAVYTVPLKYVASVLGCTVPAGKTERCAIQAVDPLKLIALRCCAWARLLSPIMSMFLHVSQTSRRGFFQLEGNSSRRSGTAMRPYLILQFTVNIQAVRGLIDQHHARFCSHRDRSCRLGVHAIRARPRLHGSS